MNICLISIFHSPDDGGGIGTYTQNLAEGLVALGHSVHVICRSKRDRDEADTVNGVEVIRLRNRYLRGIERFVPGLWWSRAVARALDDLSRRAAIDVVEFPNWEGVGWWYLRRRKRCPVVTRLHTPFQETLTLNPERRPSFGDRFTCWFEKGAVRASNSLSCSTRYHAESMGKACGFDPARVHIVPLGIELPKLAGPASPVSPSGPVRVLYVSRLERRKGTLALLQAIPLVLEQNPNVEFNLIGSSRPQAPGARQFPEYFRETCPQHAGKVRFLGHVSDAELAQHYRDCDLFVVPSEYESFGLVYVEAMAYGKPVIGGRAGGIPEVIEDGVTGYLVAPGAAEELARRIGELCRDSELRRLMGQAARHRVETQFSREMMVHRTAAFYQKVIGRSSQG